MNAIIPELSECPSCHKMFKTRGLGIHQVACNGLRKKAKSTWADDPALTNFLSYLPKFKVGEDHERVIADLCFAKLGLNAVYEFSEWDREALGIHWGLAVRNAVSHVFIEIYQTPTSSRAWFGRRDWLEAPTQIIFKTN